MEFNKALLILPVIAATIGWFTNFIAVKMLFHPRKPIKLLFFSVQGIFPKRQSEIATSVGQMVANDLLSTDDLSKNLISKENIHSIIKKIEETLDDYFEYKFPEKFPLLSKLIHLTIREKIKVEMLGEVENMAPKLIEEQIKNMNQSLDIEKIVSTKISDLSSEKLESLLMSIIERELRFIEIIGAVIGFLIGVVQVLLVLFL